MSNNKKKKKEEIQLGIERLSNNLLLAKEEGNTKKYNAIKKCLDRLMSDLKKLKNT